MNRLGIRKVLCGECKPLKPKDRPNRRTCRKCEAAYRRHLYHSRGTDFKKKINVRSYKNLKTRKAKNPDDFLEHKRILSKRYILRKRVWARKRKYGYLFEIAPILNELEKNIKNITKGVLYE